MTGSEHHRTCTGDDCDGCPLYGDLNCRFERGRLIGFLAMVLPFVTASVLGLYIVGTIIGNQIFLVAYAAFYVIFFVFIESRILCRHCPHYAREGSIIRCHANYGLPRIWRYDPRPLNGLERAGVLAGFGVFGLFPIAVEGYGIWTLFVAMGFVKPPGGLPLMGVTLFNTVSAITLLVLLRRHHCARCVNFGCPLNNTSSDLRSAYLARNPDIKRLWEEAGGRA
ncbi:hypothetical protein H8E65_05475 [Candidatus Bathyarchaeota archaeon]|nr:hypothetical protein [Candidatus Bathyarchaeota archaeon]